MATVSASAGLRAGVDRRGMTALSAGHAMADLGQGAVPALLPFLVEQRGWSYTAASALLLASTLSSSVIQPLFGVLSDRWSLSLLIPLGVFLSGLGIALTGLTENYELTFAAIVLSGVGVAAFHPEGSRYANYVSGDRRATGMSRFGVGGNLGFALGPVLTTPLVLAFGLPGTVWLVLPGALVAVWILRELPRLRSFKPAVPATRAQPGTAAAHPGPAPAWGPFARLGGVIFFRTFFYFGMSAFIPLYMVAELGASKAEANTALAVLLLAGAAGTLAGGPLADRYGRRTVLLASMAVLPLLTVAFLASGKVLATLIAGLIGAATIATFSLTVLMSQEYLPDRIGLASGVAFGLSIGLGGVGAALGGVLADAYGLRTTLEVAAVLPLLAVGLTLTLPRHTGHETRQRVAG
jgi:MFS transporter, FSR family, fosmidomycin resistance protein